jgi:Mg2+ and Co2+ transporter CorA
MMKFLYKNLGKVVSGEGANFPKGDGIIWIHATSPTESEINALRNRFNLSHSMFSKFIREKRSVRYSFNPLTFVLVDYYVEAGKFSLEDVLYVIGDKYIITVTNRKLRHYEDCFDNMREKMPKVKSVGYLFYEILDYDIEETYDVLSITENKVSDIENGILEPENIREKISTIVRFKRQLLIMWRRFWSSSKIIFTIKKGLTPVNVDTDLSILLDEVHSSLIHQMEIVSSQREVLTDSLTIFEAVHANKLAVVSNKINVSVRRLTWVMFILTGIGTVLTVPNTIATIFGIPEWPLDKTSWQSIAFLLIVSLIIPTMMFYFYWKFVKGEAKKSESKNGF